MFSLQHCGVESEFQHGTRKRSPGSDRANGRDNIPFMHSTRSSQF